MIVLLLGCHIKTLSQRILAVSFVIVEMTPFLVLTSRAIVMLHCNLYFVIILISKCHLLILYSNTNDTLVGPVVMLVMVAFIPVSSHLLVKQAHSK